jgi:hypothetical protein
MTTGSSTRLPRHAVSCGTYEAGPRYVKGGDDDDVTGGVSWFCACVRSCVRVVEDEAAIAMQVPSPVELHRMRGLTQHTHTRG